jgi:hypothetical protein
MDGNSAAGDGGDNPCADGQAQPPRSSSSASSPCSPPPRKKQIVEGTSSGGDAAAPTMEEEAAGSARGPVRRCSGNKTTVPLSAHRRNERTQVVKDDDNSADDGEEEKSSSEDDGLASGEGEDDDEGEDDEGEGQDDEEDEDEEGYSDEERGGGCGDAGEEYIREAQEQRGGTRPHPPQQQQREAPHDLPQPPEEDVEDPPPPPFDLRGNALDTFSLPYFEPYPHMATQRESLMGGKSIQAALLRCFEVVEGVVDPLGRFAADIGARARRVRAYYLTADMATKQMFAAARFKAKYDCDINTVVLEVDEIKNSLLPLLSAGPDDDDDDDGTNSDVSARTIDMSILRGFKVRPDLEEFLVPDHIYVRGCMRRIFAFFRDDVAPGSQLRRAPNMARSAALIGSPGVGKSILFFLAALYQSGTSRTLYYRRTNDEPVSLFAMSPIVAPGGAECVRVWFSRNVKCTDLESFHSDVRHCLGLLRKDAYIFVDGPLHSDVANHLHHDYDYFCTSGVPGFKSYQQKRRRWVLDGWTKRESIKWLVAFQARSGGGLGVAGGPVRNYTDETACANGNEIEGEARDNTDEVSCNDCMENEDDPRMMEYQDRAKKAYWCCGGSMREMLKSLETTDGRALASVAADLDERMKELGKKHVSIALSSTVRGTKCSDRLRTMFWDHETKTNPSFRMAAMQVVDSEYVLLSLRRSNKLKLLDLMATYCDLRLSRVRAPQGCLFALIIHQSITIEQKKDAERFPAVARVCWSKGTHDNGLGELVEPGVFWIPSKQNFPNIDSAIVCGTALYAFQMTISPKHSFDCSTFQAGFISKLKDRIVFQNVVVYFVHPTAVHVTHPSLPKRQSIHLQGELREIPLEYATHGVDMTSLESITASLLRLFQGMRIAAEAVPAGATRTAPA